jgi:hypothetical protein
MQIIVSAHRFIPMVPPAQFGSVFTCSLMTTLYPSFGTARSSRSPQRVSLAVNSLFWRSSIHDHRVFRAILIHLGSGWYPRSLWTPGSHQRYYGSSGRPGRF